MELSEKFTLWDELNEETSQPAEGDLTAKVDYLQALEGGPDGYRLRRIILCNFWLYGLQEFEVSHGRLFLTGENASGKSSVLAAALPLCLDGNLSPNRLDTFGSRQRKIDYYVLGSAESSTPYQYERRTTYIALEFEWCDPANPPIAPEIREKWLEARSPEEREKARWLTIGLSLAGNINANEKVRPVRFLVTDGSRFGHELRMVDQKNVAYDQPTFKRMLGEGGRGIICDTVAEYQAHVARYLFGINEVRDFQNIISMLLVIRQPNLGSEINFTQVHELLKQALPRIPDEITRRVTGTLERIDNIKSQIENLQEAFEVAADLDKASQKVAVAGARRAGLAYYQAHTNETAGQTRVTGLERHKANAAAALETAEAAYTALTTEQEQITGQLAALEASESLQVVDKITAARSQAQAARHQLGQQAAQLENARQALHREQTRQERLAEQHARWQTESRQSLKTLAALAAKEAEWPLAAGQLDEVAAQIAAFNLATESLPEAPLALAALAGTQAEERLNRLRELEELHQERESKAFEAKIATEKAAEKRREYDELRQRRDEAQQKVAESRDEMANRWRQFQREPDSWLGELPDYRLAELASNALRATLEEYKALVQPVAGELGRASLRLDETHSQLLQEKGGQQTRLAELEREFQRKKAEPDRLPLRTTRRQAAREVLAQRQVRAWPFYALVDFKPGLSEAQAARLENMLEEAGLLDGLVVQRPDRAAAQEILAANNLSDAFLNPSEPVSAGATLADWLVYAAPPKLTNDQAGWQSTVERLLQSLTVDRPGEDGPLNWRHGLLSGQAAASQAPGFIGLANRERLRQEELAELEKRLNHAQAELTNLESQVRQNRQRRAALEQEQARLDQLYRAEAATAAEAERDRLESERQKAERSLTDYQTIEREARQQLNGIITRIFQQSAGIRGADSDRQRVRALLEATRRLQTEAARVQLSLAGAAERWHEHHEAQGRLEADRAAVQLAATLHADSQGRTTRAESELAELEKVLETADMQALVERLGYLQERSKTLPQELQKAAVERGKAEERLNNLGETLGEAIRSLDEARQKRQAAQTTFTLKLAFYPAAALIEAQALAGKDEIIKAASALLKGEDGNNLPGEDDLEGEYNQASNHLLAAFTRQRSFLVDYGPDLDEENRIVFLAEDQIEIPALLNLLASRIELQKTLLAKEETSLFEDFLLQEMAEAIRSHIIAANDWLDNINRVLSNLPMVGERYSLDWKPLDPAEIAEGSGSRVARHHRLLSKPVETLTPEERQLIKDALSQEIDSLRLRQKDEPGLSFMEALVRIFDYREWFRFGVWITPQGGSRLRLTDRNAAARSGAEQLFALYVPLFAALAALYGSYAAHGSPRLLALDEAFDKASLANTQKIMQFLVLQGFQWIMTGPQISGMGTGVPVSAEYQMLHEKGTRVATSVPFYWIAGQTEASA